MCLLRLSEPLIEQHEQLTEAIRRVRVAGGRLAALEVGNRE
jgi:hypothetical protein